jgi:purine-nucleoside/S-methyl-5'-thioadenosine phosphorylase / adenosine deaminase
VTPLLHATVGPAAVWCSGSEAGNVGDHVGDDPAAVARHRSAVAGAAALPPPTDWAWLRQVHGVAVFDATSPSIGPLPEADAGATTRRGLPLAVVTADCAPVVIASDDALAVVHAGHRGLLGGVLGAAVERVRELGHGDLRAFLGPCIRPECYEFGANDLETIAAALGPEVAGTTRDGRTALDIPAAVRVALVRAGVDRFDDCGLCTSHTPGYFSHRRDGATGRQVTVAVLP